MTDPAVILGKEQLLRSRLKEAEQYLAAVGGTVRMRELSARERMAFSEHVAVAGEDSGAERADTMRESLTMALRCLIDGNGERLFPGGDDEGEAELAAAADTLLNDSFEAATELIGMAFKLLGFEGGRVEETVAGFTEAPSEGTSSP